MVTKNENGVIFNKALQFWEKLSIFAAWNYRMTNYCHKPPISPNLVFSVRYNSSYRLLRIFIANAMNHFSVRYEPVRCCLAPGLTASRSLLDGVWFPVGRILVLCSKLAQFLFINSFYTNNSFVITKRSIFALWTNIKQTDTKTKPTSLTCVRDRWESTMQRYMIFSSPQAFFENK